MTDNMDIKIIIKLADDTREMKDTFTSFEDAEQHIRYIKSVVQIAGNDANRAMELINF